MERSGESTGAMMAEDAEAESRVKERSERGEDQSGHTWCFDTRLVVIGLRSVVARAHSLFAGRKRKEYVD